jgi:hypothetical protein
MEPQIHTDKHGCIDVSAQKVGARASRIANATYNATPNYKVMRIDNGNDEICVHL